MFKQARLLIIATLLLGSTIHAQLDPIDVQIPMTDGEFLAGDLYLPNGEDDFPTILIITPYGKFFYAINGLPLGVGEDISESDYAFLIVDRRCRFASLSACAAGSDDGEDGYDVVEWAAEQSWSDGQLGMYGPSALGKVQFQTARTQPPHLVCCVPEVAGPREFYHKYYPGGVMTTGFLSTLNVLFPASLGPIVSFPHDNFIWDIAAENTFYPDSIEVPMLLVGGWYDHNISQTMLWSDALESDSPVSDEHKTLIGPWVHGGNGQAIVGSPDQGELSYPEAEFENELLAMEFYDHHMRGIDNGWEDRSRYTYFQMGDDQWSESETWPPTVGDSLHLYLHGDGSLDPLPPLSPSDALTFDYDPSDPSPTHGGKTLSFTALQGPYDQTDSVESRDDNLIFTTDLLTEDIRVQGRLRLDLFLSSDRLDTDIVVRLTEVYPDGRSMLLSDQIRRLRFREGYHVTDTVFMSAGEVYELPILLEDIATTFKAGNRLRIIITSSNYPRFNRNMNTGEEMYPDNNIDTLVNPLLASNTIYTNTVHPSKIVLPIVQPIPDALVDLTDGRSPGLIYPNPASDRLSFSGSLPIDHIEIIGANGELVLRREGQLEGRTLDIGALKEGSYVVKLRFVEGEERMEKVVIRR